jgi:hypothetical protein
VSTPAEGEHLATRYGTAPRRPAPLLVASLVVLATAFVGWVVWAAVGASAPDVTGEVTGFAVRGPHLVRVEVTVAGDHGPVSCRLRALGRDREVVGVTTMRTRLGPSGRSETSVPVRTRATAVSAVLDDCTVRGAR